MINCKNCNKKISSLDTDESMYVCRCDINRSIYMNNIQCDINYLKLLKEQINNIKLDKQQSLYKDI